ncbi:zinc finger MYND domain-containing protein [Phanerochaete sordida]|uniref:Zinc finger MYND domain-containing protein n=1 Tax=Phanerochaete sordida TaxID=48140 RepID=A0A9P3G4L9_9APHY|nr:zinc finger MYND domain-containing protein [Phanerochaete sordida]
MPQRFPLLRLAFPCRVPGMPSEYSSLLGWERAWENTFTLVYGITGEDPSQQIWSELIARHDRSAQCMGTALMGQAALGLPQRQAELGIELMDAFSRRDFESQWRAYTHQERQGIILEGLRRAAETAGRQCSLAGANRFFCPDASLKRLADADAESFLELAKSLLPSNLDHLGISSIAVPHPIIEQIFSSAAHSPQVLNEGIWNGFINGARSIYLTELVSQILRVFRDEALRPLFSCTAQRLKRKFTKYNLTPELAGDNPIARKLLKMAFDECRTSTAEPICAACFKTKDALPAYREYKRCARCAKRDREVLYCSRECQISHWKEGKPPHQEDCGRTDEEVAAAAKRRVVLPPAPWLPKVDPGFTCPPALLYQLMTLRRDKGKDLVYVIFGSEPGNDIAVRMPQDTEGARARRAQFLVLRNRAFGNADPDAVRALFALLSEQLRITSEDDVEYTRRVPKLRRQLEGEYGVDVGEAPMPLSAVPQATPGEIGELALLLCPDSLD